MSAPTYEETLEHFGIKGMKWGVRRSEKQLARARRKGKLPFDDDDPIVKKSQKAIAKDLRKGAAEDAAIAAALKKQASKKGPQTLSNEELNMLNQRLNLEANYARLTQGDNSKVKSGSKAVGGLALDVGMNTARNLGTQALTGILEEELGLSDAKTRRGVRQKVKKKQYEDEYGL